MWTTVDESLEDPQYMQFFSRSTWVCTTGSPCANLFPGLHDSLAVPDYYFRVRISTRASKQSYCDLTTEVIVRVHSVPLDNALIVALVFSTTGAFLLVFVLCFLFGGYKPYHALALKMEALGGKEGAKLLEEGEDESGEESDEYDDEYDSYDDEYDSYDEYDSEEEDWELEDEDDEESEEGEERGDGEDETTETTGFIGASSVLSTTKL